MGLIKEIIFENGIRIIPKPDYVSYSDIQECLSKAHAVNEKKIDLCYTKSDCKYTNRKN